MPARRRIALTALIALCTLPIQASAESHELAGSYILPDGESEKVEATFVANGSDSWQVEFRFDFQGRSETWVGSATGSLTEGQLEGRVEVEERERVFVFRGTVTNGVFEATHAEIEYGGETPTGTMTLAPLPPLQAES